MRFVLDDDAGHVIRGWVAPDNPIAISAVHVSVDGRRVATVPATRIEAGVRQLGWHSTGQCGFEIDESVVPGLAGVARLELHDVDTNVLVHRRTPAIGLCPERVVLVGTGVHPDRALEAALYPFFRQSYFGLGKFSQQVLTSLFDTVTLTSCLMSGAILLPPYEGHIVQGNALTMMLVQDPFVEMAARLLWLRARVALGEDPAQSWRLGRLAEAASATRGYDFADSKSLKRFFQMLPEPAYHFLYNPLTRQLATRSPDDRIHPANSMLAVEVLARIGTVGHRDHFEVFAATVFDRLGIQAPLPAASAIPEETLALAKQLQGIAFVRDFVVYDAVMSDAVRRAVAKSWAD